MKVNQTLYENNPRYRKYVDVYTVLKENGLEHLLVGNTDDEGVVYDYSIVCRASTPTSETQFKFLQAAVTAYLMGTPDGMGFDHPSGCYDGIDGWPGDLVQVNFSFR